MSGIYKNLYMTMLSIVSFMKTDAGKAVILLGGGIGNYIHMCTVKMHDVLKKKNTSVQSVCNVTEPCYICCR
jgi:hypothetical protein